MDTDIETYTRVRHATTVTDITARPQIGGSIITPRPRQGSRLAEVREAILARGAGWYAAYLLKQHPKGKRLVDFAPAEVAHLLEEATE
jgi:hypothetical protein